MPKDNKKIIETLLCAVEKSFTALFEEHGNEHFYYCTIVMADGAASCISAQSEKSLRLYLKENDVSDDEILDYKWSWADSYYCAYGYDEFFGEVMELFDESFREVLNDDDKFESKYNEWFSAMETVMKMLDEKGLFGSGDNRDRVFVYAEESPPDEEFENEYRERAERMNPSDVYKMWLADQEAM